MPTPPLPNSNSALWTITISQRVHFFVGVTADNVAGVYHFAAFPAHAFIGMLGGMAIDEAADIIIVRVRIEALLKGFDVVQIGLVAHIAHGGKHAFHNEDAAALRVITAGIEQGKRGQRFTDPVHRFGNVRVILFGAFSGRTSAGAAFAHNAVGAVGHLGYVAKARAQAELRYQPVQPLAAFHERIEGMERLVVLLVVIEREALKALLIFIGIQPELGLIAALAAVVNGPEPAYLHALEDMRHEIGGYGLVGYPVHVANEICLLLAGFVIGKVALHAFVEVERFAYVNDLAGRVVEVVNAGRLRQIFHLFHGHVGRQVLLLVAALEHFFEHSAIGIARGEVREEQRGGVRIAVSAVMIGMRYLQIGAELAERVGAQAGRQLPCQAHGAEAALIKLMAAALEVMLYEGVIKIDVVRHEYLILQQAVNMLRDFLERRCAGHQLGRDAGKLLDKPRDGPVRIDERLPGMKHRAPVVNDDGNLGDAAARGIASRRLDIYNGKQHLWGEKRAKITPDAGCFWRIVC